MTCDHSRYKPRTGRGKTLVAYKNLRYFPITLRLQRLFMSPRTAEHMTWHQSHHVVDGVMVHPSDGEAWKHFNSVHPHFSAESRNVRFGLCTDEFNPFGSFAAPYSCWLVILMVYNLPPGMAGVHVFIYGHTRSEQSEAKYRCLSSTVDWWVDTIVVLWSFDLWHLEET